MKFILLAENESHVLYVAGVYDSYEEARDIAFGLARHNSGRKFFITMGTQIGL